MTIVAPLWLVRSGLRSCVRSASTSDCGLVLVTLTPTTWAGPKVPMVAEGKMRRSAAPMPTSTRESWFTSASEITFTAEGTVRAVLVPNAAAAVIG